MKSKQRRFVAMATERRSDSAARPESPDALVAAALGAHQAGRLLEAEALYSRALALEPKHVDALSLSGALAFALGRFGEAIKRIQGAVRVKPDHVAAWLNLAEAYEAAERTDEALDASRQALAVAPNFVDAHARISRLLAMRGDSQTALTHAQAALAAQPDCVEALIGRGLALKSLRRWAEAEACFRMALETAPDDWVAITGLASTLHETEQLAEVLAVYRRALKLRPKDLGTIVAMGDALARSGNLSEAKAAFGQAIQIDPRSPDVRLQFGRLLRDQGQFGLAEHEFRAALALKPGFAPAHLALARLGRIDDTSSLRNRLDRLLNDASRSTHIRAPAGFALGEILERAGEYDEAFLRYSEANDIQARDFADNGHVFDHQELVGLVDRFEEGLAVEFARDASGWAVETDLPAFVVGPLRSGTTLVEQICAAHPEVVGAGELKAIQIAEERIGRRNQGKSIADWDADAARAEAEKHAEWLKLKSAGAKRVVDKHPFNLTRLGYIAAMFPRAKVIRCRRDPRDVAVSNFTTFFKDINPWSTSLRETGQLIRQLERHGDVWARSLNLAILEVVYEELVSDLEGGARRIIEFLGLDWNAACLRFYEADRHVNTPSAWQVRQPIYSKSVGRWRRFERHLGPLFEALAGDG